MTLQPPQPFNPQDTVGLGSHPGHAHPEPVKLILCWDSSARVPSCWDTVLADPGGTAGRATHKWAACPYQGDIFGSLAPHPADSWCWLLRVLAQGKAPKRTVEKVTRSELSAPQPLQALSSIWWVSVGGFLYYSLQMLKGGCLQNLVCLLLLCMILAQLVL